MIRAEIFTNQSMQEVLINNLEAAIPDFFYTIVPLVHGRGGDSYKLGTSTWPETNFVLVSYIEEKELETAKAVIRAIKEKFPGEGIKLFAVRAESL